jgi:hypothetical protein
MLKIKDYIFNENEILQISKGVQNTLFLTLKYSDKLQQIDNATIEDIEWNYGTPQETQRKMQKELCKSCYYRDTISNKLKEFEEKNKTFEDYNKDLNNQLDKLEEENKQLKEENQAVRNIIKKNSIPVKENYLDYYKDTPKEEIQVLSRWSPPRENKKIEKIDVSNFPKRNNSLKKTALKLNEIIDKINGDEENDK